MLEYSADLSPGGGGSERLTYLGLFLTLDPDLQERAEKGMRTQCAADRHSRSEVTWDEGVGRALGGSLAGLALPADVKIL